MRPIPSRKHHLALLALLLAVAANLALTYVSPEISGDQANMLAEAIKQDNSAQYPHDEVFGPTGEDAPWRLRLPAWRWLLTSAMHVAGRADPANALRLVGALALLVYVCSMYLLLYRQTHSTSVAALATVISTAIFSIKRPYWGMGPLFSVSPTMFYMALTPLIVQGLLRWRGRWRIVLVFLLAGLAGNIDVIFAINLVFVMAIVVVALGRCRPKSWAMAAASLAAAAIGAAPAIWHYARAFLAAESVLAKVPASTVAEALQLGGLNVLYPALLIEAMRWLPVAAGLAIPAAIILNRAGRYRVEHLGAWIWLLVGSLVTAFGVHGLMQLLGRWLGIVPPFLGFLDSLRLAMLPLYALFTQAMVQLVRLSRTHRAWVRAALGVFAVVYLGSSYNTLPLRHMVADTAAAVSGKPESPRGQGKSEIRAIAVWARQEANTPSDCLFIAAAGQAEIRAYARRSVLASPDDVRHMYYLAPGRLAEWTALLRLQQAELAPPQTPTADAQRLVAFADSQARRREAPNITKFIVIKARHAPEPVGRLVETLAPQGQWGAHWRLYRVDPPEQVNTKPG